jgi:hypothetical protein
MRGGKETSLIFNVQGGKSCVPLLPLGALIEDVLSFAIFSFVVKSCGLVW